MYVTACYKCDWLWNHVSLIFFAVWINFPKLCTYFLVWNLRNQLSFRSFTCCEKTFILCFIKLQTRTRILKLVFKKLIAFWDQFKLDPMHNFLFYVKINARCDRSISTYIVHAAYRPQRRSYIELVLFNFFL